jgi:hypothetical protein
MAELAESRDPFSRSYYSLRRELARGLRSPGSKIRVDETARQLSISSTPVREALAMLAGERLVNGCRRQGFWVPRPSASDLVHLYTLSEMYLLTAIRLQSAKRVTTLSNAFQAAGAIEDGCSVARLFIAILARAEMSCLLDAGVLTIERLASARLAEDPALVDRDREEFATLLVARRFAELAKGVRAYHSARRADAVRIAKHVGGAGNDGKYIPDMI